MIQPKHQASASSRVVPMKRRSSGNCRLTSAIRTAIAEFPDVCAVVQPLTMRLRLDSVLVTGEINIADDLSTDEIERLLSRIATRVREAAPEVKNIYLEPHPVPRPTR